MQLKQQALELLEHLNELQTSTYSFHYELDRKDLKKENEGDLADLGWIQRSIERKLDELRKEYGHRQRTIGTILCVRVMKGFQQDSSRDFKAVGEYAMALPKTKAQPVLPRFGSPEYLEVMKKLGVPEAMAKKGCLQIHFPKMTDYLTEQQEAGKNHGFEVKPEFTVTYRKRPISK
jgi:hypothetical protein